MFILAHLASRSDRRGRGGSDARYDAGSVTAIRLRGLYTRAEPMASRFGAPGAKLWLGLLSGASDRFRGVDPVSGRVVCSKAMSSTLESSFGV